jgi:hypothetical protein
VAFGTDAYWPVLKTGMSAEEADPLVGQVGRPGLWKWVAGEEGLYRVFELPLSLCEGTEPSAFGSLLSWALDTVEGDRPEGWQAPPREEVEAMIPTKGLTLRSGALARQGELLCGPDGLALRFPVVQHVPEGLSDCRIYWLRRLLLEAQTYWRLARAGSVGDLRGSPVHAEVNLTGAPHGMLAGMIALALAALHAIVAWTVQPAVFLVDRGTEDRALEMYGNPPSLKNPFGKGGDV